MDITIGHANQYSSDGGYKGHTGISRVLLRM